MKLWFVLKCDAFSLAEDVHDTSWLPLLLFDTGCSERESKRGRISYMCCSLSAMFSITPSL